MTEIPLDDAIDCARTCARVLAEKEMWRAKRWAYRRLRRKLLEESKSWRYGDAQDRMFVRVYLEQFRASLKAFRKAD